MSGVTRAKPTRFPIRYLRYARLCGAALKGRRSASGTRIPSDRLTRVDSAIAGRRCGAGGRWCLGGSCQLLGGERVGEAGQRIRPCCEAGLGQDPVDHRLERRDRKQLGGEAIAESQAIAVTAIGAVAGSTTAAEQAASV